MRVIDSHTEGQPTRVIPNPIVDLGHGTLRDRLKLFQEEYDYLRRRILCEPRGSDAQVGALICTPHNPDCDAGVIFFNTSSFLGMCGHATIGLAVTMQYLGLWSPGHYTLETPVGVVKLVLNSDNSVSFQNVRSFVLASDVRLDVRDFGEIEGEVAWGGNWFFLVKHCPIEILPSNINQLTQFAKAVKSELSKQKVTGTNGEEIDHVELFSNAKSSLANSRNFVLCPSDTYDRSPCGTGTSAKVASLAKSGLLEPKQVWKQEGLLGGVFTATYETAQDSVIPTITGKAFVTSDSTLIFNDDDPFVDGFLL